MKTRKMMENDIDSFITTIIFTNNIITFSLSVN